MSSSISRCKRNAKIQAADSHGGHFFDEIESDRAEGKKMTGWGREREREK